MSKWILNRCICFAAALADAGRRGKTDIAADILRANELTIGDLEGAGVDESDLEELRAVAIALQ